jgi:hypothetical protein
MKTIEWQLYDFIEDQKDYEYITSKGIIISSLDIEWLTAEFKWINIEYTSLSVIFSCPMTEFVNIFGIKNMSDIEDLAPVRLMELYYEGLAETVCFLKLNYIYCMCFKKLGNSIVAENERGFKHNIPLFKEPETPEQYILYTKEYYTLMECNEN